ncbi:hypothetical protein Dda_1581 [Drechslerella dactyloides]|uniref:Uncharacterized protein n=1 Tax=Drechslerella dactyloides TaxID=74499 RepID=A0AAD6J1Z3_DREDA|nr:hypothetical protein Dda_1581 [Drechslerella dactyloides]
MRRVLSAVILALFNAIFTVALPAPAQAPIPVPTPAPTPCTMTYTTTMKLIPMIQLGTIATVFKYQITTTTTKTIESLTCSGCHLEVVTVSLPWGFGPFPSTRPKSTTVTSMRKLTTTTAYQCKISPGP